MQPLRPIRPTISLLRLLLLALVLRSSVFDHLVGVSLGVFAAPTSPKSRPPPTISITGATPPMDPASSNQHQSVDSVRPNHVLNRPMSTSPPATPSHCKMNHDDFDSIICFRLTQNFSLSQVGVQLPFEVDRKSQNGVQSRVGLPLLDNEVLQGKIGRALIYTVEEDQPIVKTTRGIPRAGELMGMIKFRSHTTMLKSLDQMEKELSQIKPEDAVSALFFIAFGVFLLEEDPDVDVQMKREWYVMLWKMILMGVSGEGEAVSPNDVAKWDHYLLMGKKLNDALKDPNISGKQMNEFFDLRKKQTDTLTEYYS
ncbi:hypothetical protein EV361DRAFT_956192 [Lentinula raphanica]|nr:hypothetical protein EV361DRAFT_956192 [Lentinula raphanica]